MCVSSFPFVSRLHEPKSIRTNIKTKRILIGLGTMYLNNTKKKYVSLLLAEDEIIDHYNGIIVAYWKILKKIFTNKNHFFLVDLWNARKKNSAPKA